MIFKLQRKTINSMKVRNNLFILRIFNLYKCLPDIFL